MNKELVSPRPLRTPRCKKCRLKKIKCDYVLPRCGPCVKSGLRCEPYRHRFIFVPVATLQNNDPRHAMGMRRQYATLPTTFDLVQSPMLNGSQARSSIFEGFLQFYFPNTPGCLESPSYTWASTVMQNCQSFDILETAASAISALMMGRETNDTALQRYSVKMYGDALAKARDDWRNINKDNWFKPLLGVNLFFLYELLIHTFTDPGRAYSHNVGLATLLQVAGPDAFNQPATYSVFQYARTALIYTDVLEGKPSFLATDEWMTKPWAVIPKTLLHHGLDIMEHICSLNSFSHQIVGAAQGNQPFKALLQHFDAKLVQLQHMLSVMAIRLRELKGNLNVNDFTALQNQSACKILIYEATRRLGNLSEIDPEAFEPYKLRADKDRSMVTDLATSILASFCTFDLDGCGFLGMKFIFLPACIAVNFLRQHGQELSHPGIARLKRAFKGRGFQFFLKIIDGQ